MSAWRHAQIVHPFFMPLYKRIYKKNHDYTYCVIIISHSISLYISSSTKNFILAQYLYQNSVTFAPNLKFITNPSTTNFTQKRIFLFIPLQQLFYFIDYLLICLLLYIYLLKTNNMITICFQKAIICLLLYFAKK